MREILKRHGVVTDIAKKVGRVPRTVSLALKGATDSELTQCIRETALDKYGCTYVPISFKRQTTPSGFF